MRRLTDSALTRIAGASEGTYYFDGISYDYVCTKTTKNNQDTHDNPLKFQKA